MSTDDTRAGEAVTESDRRDVAAWLVREADQRVKYFPQRRDGVDALMRHLASDLLIPRDDTRAIAGEVAAEEVEGERQSLINMLAQHVYEGRSAHVQCSCGWEWRQTGSVIDTFGAASNAHITDAILASDWLADHDARARAADAAEIERLREAVNRQHGEPIDEVYTVDGLTIVMGTIHDLRAERDRLAAGVRELQLSLNGDPEYLVTKGSLSRRLRALLAPTVDGETDGGEGSA